ncbi:MAG: O-antigen ligase family protein [Patescibacteria group bacterium]|jgi:O-antigen ligase
MKQFPGIRDNQMEIICTIFGIACVSFFLLAVIVSGFNLLLYIFCFSLVSIVIFLYPRIGISIAIFSTVVFERIFTLTPLIISDAEYKFYPLDLIIVITLVAWLMPYLVNRKKILNFQQNKWLIISCSCFFFLLAISFVRAYLTGADLALAFSANKNFIFYSLFFLLVVALIDNKHKLITLLASSFFGAISVLSIFLMGLITGQAVFTEYIPLSTYGERYLGGGYTFFLALAVIWIFSFFVFKQYKEKNWLYYSVWVALLISLIALALSLIRHIWLGLAVAVIFYFIFLGKRQKWEFAKIVSIMLFLIVLGTFLVLYVNYWQGEAGFSVKELFTSIYLRVQSIFTFSYADDSALWRREAWLAAYKVFTHNIVFGIGLGKTLTLELFNYESEVDIRELHNDFVAIALQMGLTGLLLIFWFIFEIMRRFVKIYRETDKAKQQYLLPAAACLVLFLFSANFGTYFDLNLLVIFFWIMLAIVINTPKYTRI